MMGVWFNLSPTITVEPSANIDPERQYATQILITNRGHVPIYHLRFACGIGAGGGSTTLNGTLTPPDLRPIAVLAAGQSITRSCDVGLHVEGNTRLGFETTFDWPLIGRTETKTSIFELRRGSPGYFLVPGSLP
jgi:hypothetical protein